MKKEENNKKTISLPEKCSRCDKEPYGWFIENNNKLDFIALCYAHLIDFVDNTKKYEMNRN